MKIRQGRREDYGQVLGLVNEFAEESLKEYGVVVDTEKIGKMVEALYSTSFVGEIDEKIVGVFAGQVIFDSCSNFPVYEEIMWYVGKDHRKYGMKLFRYAEKWCKENGVDRITVACMHNSKTEKLFKLYKKLGFGEVETRFAKLIRG